MSEDAGLDAQQVAAVRAGDRDAFAPLVDRWFDRCWAVAVRILHDRDLAADVAQDTLVTAWQQLDRLERPEAFGGWVLRIARNRSLDRLARERRAVPTADHDALEPRHDAHDAASQPEAAHARAEQRDLVWAAAAALGERDASLLDLHLRHGMEPAELADELGIAPNAAHQAMFRLRSRLGTAIRAWVLWRHGEPTCPELQAAVADTGTFGPATVRAVDAHVTACAACREDHERVGAPAALFAAVPLAVPPAFLRADAVRAMAAAGVPVPDLGSGTGPAAADLDPTDPLPVVPGPPADDTVVLPATPGGAPDAAAADPEEEDDDRRVLAWAGLAVLLLVLLVGGWWQLRGGDDPDAMTVVATPDDPTTAPTSPSPSPTPTPSPTETDTASPTPEPTPTPTATEPDPPPSPTEPPAPPPPPPPPPPSPTPSPSTPTSTPSPTASPTVSPTPTATEPSPTETETGTPPSPAPTILRFTAVDDGPCEQDQLQRAYLLTWATEAAESATMTGPDGTGEPVAPSGTTTWCAPRSPVPSFTLTATGPGGTTSETTSPS